MVRLVIFRITLTSGLIMGQICRHFLHAFSVNSGVILKKSFLQKYFVFCVREVYVKDFNGSKRIKDSF